MSTAPIAAISLGHVGSPEALGNEAVQGNDGPSFQHMLGSALGSINESVNGADASIRAMAAGENVPVQDVMIAIEHAHLELQFAVEVRNRLVSAYQGLTNMQL
jgi:flagellar hook-basal body complex protein FliE